MDKQKAQKILEDHYQNSYVAPACTGCGETLLGDVLKYEFNLKAAAIKLNVFIKEVDLPDIDEIGILLKHNRDLSPIQHCGHGKSCCMMKS